MEVALRRRLEGVTHVSISQSQQTAAVTFAPGTHAFSGAAFRSAVAEADVEVVSLEMDVCGVISDSALRWESGRGTPLLLVRGAAPTNRLTCVSGRLNDQVAPYELNVTQVQR